LPANSAGVQLGRWHPFSPNPLAHPAAGTALNPRYSFDDFVIGQPNEFAYACARRVAEHPACSGFNPLFLYGEAGVGKTHLLQAIARHLTHRGGKTAGIIYMSAGEWRLTSLRHRRAK